MKRQFSISSILWLVAACAVLFSMTRRLGYDGFILTAPLLGAATGRWLAREEIAPTFQRWVAKTFAGGFVAIAVCLVDPRPHIIRTMDLVVGIPICLLYGLAATAFLEVSLTIRRHALSLLLPRDH